MNDYDYRKVKYLGWELVLLILIIWMGMQISIV